MKTKNTPHFRVSFHDIVLTGEKMLQLMELLDGVNTRVDYCWQNNSNYHYFSPVNGAEGINFTLITSDQMVEYQLNRATKEAQDKEKNS